MRIILALLMSLTLIHSVNASIDDNESPPANPWANSPYHEWMSKQIVNEWARRPDRDPYIPWTSCCDHTDRVQTQFRVDKSTGKDQWWWLDPKDSTWKLIPEDIIHEEYDPSMPEQLRREGVLFVYQGKPTCFWYPEGGI